MEAGHLVSDDIILGVVREELAKPEAAKGVIFDGVVRTIPQAEGMERILAEQGRQDGRGAVLRRDRRGDPRPARPAARRSRAGPTTIPRRSRTRLKAYREQTAPVLAWYAGARRRAPRFPPSAPSRRSPDRVQRGARTGSSMITLKSPREIEIMARAGRIVAATLALMRETRPARASRPRTSTPRPRSSSAATTGATPSFKGLYGFPKTLCTSINDEIVHGIPSTAAGAARGQHRERGRGRAARGLARRLGHDHRRSGEIAPEAERLLAVTQECAGRGHRAGAGRQSRRRHRPRGADRWPRRRATAWCGSWWDTGSAPGSTRSRRCPTTAARSAGPGCSRA